MLKGFLTDILHVEPQRAAIEACGIEHSISNDTAEKLEQLINTLKADE